MTVLLYLFVNFISFSNAARILAVFPIPSISHQVVFRPLTQELAKRGHEVVVITTDPVFTKGAPANLTEIDVYDVSYAIWEEHFMKTSKGNKKDLANQMEVILDAIVLLVDAQIKDEQVQKMLQDKNQKFDLVFTEACVRSSLIYAHIYKAPVIQISSFGAVMDNYESIGAPVHPFLYPAVTRQKICNLTLWEKVTELYNNYLLDRSYENMKGPEQRMLHNNFGDSVPNTYLDRCL